MLAANGSLVEQLVKSAKTSAEIVDELYLATLSRHPLREEKQIAVDRGSTRIASRAPKTCTGACSTSSISSSTTEAQEAMNATNETSHL